MKIWDLDENSQWTSDGNSEWKAHLSGVTSLSWGHPEFGQLLATSGSDGFAIIWEERAEGSFGASASGGGVNGGFHNAASSLSEGSASGSAAFTGAARWTDRAKLTDSRKALSCVKFAPRHLRLQLATGSADGIVRIYEAVDVMNLNLWSLRNSITVGTDTSSELGVTCLDWCGGRFEPSTLVVGDSKGDVNIYRYSDRSENWGLYLKLEGHVSPMRRGVLDVAWSPDVGRSFHLISSCGRDGVLRVHRLKKNADGRGALELESSQELDEESDTWRCAWNVTGTVLASSGDGGMVKLWKSGFKGDDWTCVSDVHGSVRNQAKKMQMAP